MVTAGIGDRFSSFELCAKCGESIKNFLQKKKLIEEE